jgi:polyphosphate glucokinase
LVPNLELGHLFYKDSIAEHFVSNKARETKDLSWEKWGKELNKFLNHIDFVIRPDSIILGGGVSKKLDKYRQYLKLDIPIKSAMMLNNAGIVGAALAGHQRLRF